MNALNGHFSIVDVRSLHERVYEEMRHALSQGSFSLGQSLTIRGLAQAIGTSEMPVREAIKRLVSEKMIVQMSNRTFQVPMLDWRQFEDILSLRIALEGMAAQRAVANADDALLDRLTLYNQEMRDAILSGDQKQVLKSNQLFHFALYAASGSEIMPEMIESLWMRSGPYLSKAISTIEGAAHVFQQATSIHETIITALREKDELAVFEALKSDLLSVANWYGMTRASFSR